MFRKLKLSKAFISSCAKISVTLCLVIFCTMTARTQCNSQYDIDFSNSLGTSNGTLFDNGTAMSLPDNLGSGGTCTCDDGNTAGDNCFEMEIVNTNGASCATVELDASNGYVVDPTADCSTIDENNTSVDIDLTQSTTVLICKSSGGNLTVQRLRAMPCMEDCGLVVTCPPSTATIACDDENPADLFGLIGGAIDSTTTAPCGDVVITSDFVFPGVCGGNVSTTFTITDGVTTTTCVSQISTVLSAPPVITNCPPDTEILCAADAVADPSQFEFTTDCAETFVVVGDVQAADTNSACGETIGDQYFITYRVGDECGSSTSQCTQTFTIAGPKPIITACPPDRTVSCTLEIAAEISAVQAEGCGLELTVVADEILFDPANSACGESTGDKYMIRYSVFDECGNLNECLQTFTIDAPGPMITTCAPDMEITCFTEAIIDINLVEFTTGCGNPATVTVGGLVGDAANSTCGQTIGDKYTVEYTVTDDCGNVDTCIQTFTFVGPKPRIIACAPDVSVSCFAEIAPDISAVQFAACGVNVTVIPGEIIGNTGNSACGESPGDRYTIDYRVLDECGNENVCTQTFTMTGYLLEIIECAPDREVTCFSEIVPDISAIQTQGCGSEVTVEALPIIPDPANSACGESAGDQYTIRYTVIDECTNANSCVQTFTIVGNEGPQVTCPAEITLSCGDALPAPETTLPGTDDCDSATEFAVTNVVDSTLPTSFCGGSDLVIGRIYTVVDDCGNESQCNQIIRFVEDTEGPMVNCPADVTGLPCDANLPAPETVLFGTDNCDSSTEFVVINVEDSGSIPDVFCAGDSELIITRTYTVADECGNESQCEQRFVFVSDSEPPQIQCPANVTGLACGQFLPIAETMLAGVDNCDPATMFAVRDVQDGQLPTSFCPGDDLSVTRTYTVADACGNETSCVQTFTFLPNDTPPVVICPEDCPVACASDIRPGTPEYTTSCGTSATVSVSDPVIDGDPHCDGTTYTYTYTVTDECGNSTTCDQVFTIVNDCHFIDFDYDAHGNLLAPSTTIFDQYEDFTVTTDNPYRCVQLFDTGNPTSNDYDMGTPNQQYGGPGIGAGGMNNTEFQGNALIVSKDCGVPNETEGQLIFTFDCSVTIKTVDLLDMKCGYSEIELYDEHHNLIEELPIPGYGVNSFNTFDVFVSGVYTMIVDLDCGGGVTGFKYCKDNTPGANCEVNDLCEDYNLDFDNSGYHWMTNATSGSFDVGDQNYTISIADNDNILEDTYEYGGGLLIGIDPHDVYDEVVVCYNLSQASNHVSFDVHDLDYKNYTSSKQQEAVCVYGLLGDDPTQILPTVTSLDGHVDVNGNCAEATTDSAQSHDDESVLVEFDECIDKVVIVYGTGSNSPTHNPSYSKITIGKRLGFNSKVCPGECVVSDCGSLGDDDGDGVCNDIDICPGGNDNIDSDGDGIPDACDDICYDYNIDHGDCGAGWQHGDESGTVELGLETISIDILDDDNILENTNADGAGLLVGIDPHTVDDELIVCYTLSESSSNVVFDIVDLDYKNSGSKQQEAVCVYGTLGSNSTQILPTITSLDGHVDVDGNCAEATTNSATSGDDESVLVEFTECIDKITIVYGTGSNSPTHNPTYSKIVIGESIFSVEQCKDGCDEPCPVVDTGGGPIGGDADGDGVCDGDDICPGGDDNMDTDGDGKPDFCDDDCTTGSAPLGDEDGDFVCDFEDQCPGFDDNIDENNNGIPDGCEVECEDYALDFSEPGYDWSGHGLMDSYIVDNQIFDVRIIDGDHILTSSHDRASGLAVGTNPHDVNDEVVICYSLSEVVSNVRFDIVDLDYKTGGSRQQEAVCVYGTLGNDPTQIMPMITSLDGNVAINGNCAEATANSSVSGRDESVLVEFTECIDKVTIVYGTGSNSPTSNPDHGKITIGQDIGFVTEVCSNTCPEPRIEDEENAHISLYPNPVYGSNNVTIEIETEARGDAQVILVDALGRTVSSENIQLVDDLTIHQFSTDRLAAGVYFVQLQTNEWRTDGLKLVVVKP